MLVGNIIENCVGTIDKESNIEEYEKMFGAEYDELEKTKAKNTSIIVNELTEIEKIGLLSDEGITAVAKEIRLFMKYNQFYLGKYHQLVAQSSITICLRVSS